MSASKWHFRVNLWVNVQISSLIWVKLQIPRDSLLGWVEVCPQNHFSAFQSQPLPFPCPVCRRQLQREVRFPSSGLTPSLQPRSITVTWAFQVSEQSLAFASCRWVQMFPTQSSVQLSRIYLVSAGCSWPLGVMLHQALADQADTCWLCCKSWMSIVCLDSQFLK